MQKYQKELKEKTIGRKILTEFLDFLRDKIANGALTLEEEQSFIRLIERELPLSATCDDLARYYHQSPGNIRAVIHRRLLSKPKRRVMYSFLDFSKIVPDKWVK